MYFLCLELTSSIMTLLLLPFFVVFVLHPSLGHGFSTDSIKPLPPCPPHITYLSPLLFCVFLHLPVSSSLWVPVKGLSSLPLLIFYEDAIAHRFQFSTYILFSSLVFPQVRLILVYQFHLFVDLSCNFHVKTETHKSSWQV